MSDEMELETTKAESTGQDEAGPAEENMEALEATENAVEVEEEAVEIEATAVDAPSAEVEAVEETETAMEATAIEVEAEAAEEMETALEATAIGVEEEAVEEVETVPEVEAVAECSGRDGSTSGSRGSGRGRAGPAPAPPAPKPRGESEMDYSNTFRELTEGDVVPGVVVHIDKEGVLVDVGTKSERGSYSAARAVARSLPVGGRRRLRRREDQRLRDGDREPGRQSDTIQETRRFRESVGARPGGHGGEKVINAMVTDRVKGGLVVDLGIRGFVPASRVGSGKVKNLDKYVGQSLPLKVIEVDRERRKVVLSHRLAIEEEREKKRVATGVIARRGPGARRRGPQDH